MSASVLATGRAFSSQRAREISSRAGCRQAARARARIQQKSARASSQISEFRSCMHANSVSWIHERAGGWEPAHAMVWSRLPGRRAPPNGFGKPAKVVTFDEYRKRMEGKEVDPPVFKKYGEVGNWTGRDGKPIRFKPPTHKGDSSGGSAIRHVATQH